MISQRDDTTFPEALKDATEFQRFGHYYENAVNSHSQWRLTDREFDTLADQSKSVFDTDFGPLMLEAFYGSPSDQLKVEGIVACLALDPPPEDEMFNSTSLLACQEMGVLLVAAMMSGPKKLQSAIKELRTLGKILHSKQAKLRISADGAEQRSRRRTILALISFYLSTGRVPSKMELEAQTAYHPEGNRRQEERGLFQFHLLYHICSEETLCENSGMWLERYTYPNNTPLEHDSFRRCLGSIGLEQLPRNKAGNPNFKQS